MIRGLRLWVVLGLLAVLGGGGSAFGVSAVGAGGSEPRLVVLISIDQFRGDYLTRFQDLWLPAKSAAPANGTGGVGGFRYLMERGAYFTDAHHDHFPLFTGPGHSVLLTGAPPYKSGIVGNYWYDRGLGRRRYCVEDAASPLVGAKGTGVSPSTLRVSTLGDELKMATGGKAKVWGLAFKDRAAVLMAGRLADGVLWFDEDSASWITSTFYRPDGTLPPWVAKLNGERRVDRWFGKTWTPQVTPAALERAWTPSGKWASDAAGLGTAFPHPVTGGAKAPGKEFYAAFTTTPFGNEYVLETARDLVRTEGLGQDDVPDVLAINLSSNDYIGHAFGPDSPEVLDAAVRTDAQLAAFFGFLNQTVPGGLARVVLVLTADHGVAPGAGAAKEARFPAGVYDDKTLAAAAEAGLTAAYGPGPWVTSLIEENVYLDLPALAAHKIAPAAAEEVAAAALAAQPGIYAAYTRTHILAGMLPRTDIADRVERSFHPQVSGDVVLVGQPYWMAGRLTGSTHGSPYAYDTSVPLLLAGDGILPRRITTRVSTLDLAPTLADLLGVLQPSGNEGHVLAGIERHEAPAPHPGVVR